ncbi:MAG: glycosyltransferase [Clostridia bacterium]|nr:glycosyltransferase [Clostridia bacterium]
MNAQPKVSVVIPVYNADQYLEACLDSVLGQTLTEIEVICVDDGSTDDSLAILRAYEQRDSRLTVLHQQNQYAGTARNKGLAAATGEYVIFLDADDYFEPNMLEEAYETLERSGAEVCVFGCNLYDVQENTYKPCAWAFRKEFFRLNTVFDPHQPPYSDNIFRMFSGWAWDKMFRRDFVLRHGLLFQGLRSTNDMYFTYIALAKAERVIAIDRIFVHQRINIPTSISSTRVKSWDNFLIAFAAMKEELVRCGLYETYAKAYLNLCANLSLWQMNTMHGAPYADAYEHLRKTGFAQLGLVGAKKADFFNPKEYEQIQRILAEPMLPDELVVDADALNARAQDVPMVSVIMPSLNVGRYMRQCLKSVMNQTLRDIEIICVDAGSTDGTLEIIEECAAKDSRIRLIRSDRKSYGYQMNLGLAAATGKYIGIIETDDYAPEDMYAILYSAAEQYGAQVVKANHIRTSEAGDEYTESLAGLPYNTVFAPEERQHVFMTPPAIWSGLYLREMLVDGGVLFAETPGASYQDTGFILKVWMAAKRVLLLRQPLYRYRTDNENSSVKSGAKVYCLCDEFDSVREYTLAHPEAGEKFASILFKRKGHAYIWNYKRLADEFRLDFLYHVREELLRDAGERPEVTDVLTGWPGDFIRQVMDLPELVYYANRGEIRPEQPPVIAQAEACDAPRLSIVVFDYDGAQYSLNTGLTSLVRQTMPEIEILCISVQGENPSEEIIRAFAQKDGRVRLLAPAATKREAWEQALREARAAYILPFNGMNVLARDAARRIIDRAEQSGADMIPFHGWSYDPVHLDAPRSLYFNSWVLPKDGSRTFADLDPAKRMTFFNFEIWAAAYRREFLADVLERHPSVCPDVLRRNVPFGVAAAVSAQGIAAIHDQLLVSNRDAVRYHMQDRLETVGNLEGVYSVLRAELQEGDIEAEFINFALPVINSALDMIPDPLKRMELADMLDWSPIGLRSLLQLPEHVYRDIELRDKIRGILLAREWVADQERMKRSGVFSVVLPYRGLQKPRVSVIVPAYNTGNYLAECIDSILGQSLAELELILVNDGSSDGSLEIMLDYAKKDERVCVIDQPNAGLSNARNHGVSVAQGDYIHFIDSDDMIAAETLEELAACADKAQLDAVFFDGGVFSNEFDVSAAQRFMRLDYYTRRHDYSAVCTGPEYIVRTVGNAEYRANACMQMIRREMWLQHNLCFRSGIVHEDNLYTFDILAHAKRVCHINKPYYRRRLRRDSIVTQAVRFKHSYGYFSCYMGMLQILDGLQGLTDRQASVMRTEAGKCLNSAIMKLQSVPVEERFCFYALPPEECSAFQSLVYRPAKAEMERAKASEQAKKAAEEADRLKRQMSSDSARMKQEEQRLKGESIRLKSEAEKLRSGMDQLRGEAQALKGENSQLRSETDRLKGENSRLKSETEKLKSGMDQLRGEAQTLKSENGQLRSEAGELRRESERLRRDIRALKREIRELKSQERKLRSDLRSIRGSVSFRVGRVLTAIPRKAREILRGIRRW